MPHQRLIPGQRVADLVAPAPKAALVGVEQVAVLARLRHWKMIVLAVDRRHIQDDDAGRSAGLVKAAVNIHAIFGIVGAEPLQARWLHVRGIQFWPLAVEAV